MSIWLFTAAFPLIDQIFFWKDAKAMLFKWGKYFGAFVSSESFYKLRKKHRGG